MRGERVFERQRQVTQGPTGEAGMSKLNKDESSDGTFAQKQKTTHNKHTPPCVGLCSLQVRMCLLVRNFGRSENTFGLRSSEVSKRPQ